MNYIASITDFFNHPKWVMNLIFTGICMLIPIVGPMVAVGWLIAVLWTPGPINVAAAPAFDFGKFGTYLERGLWPFLVTLVAGIVGGIVIFIIGIIPAAILGFVFGHGRGFLPLIGGSISSLVWMILMAAVIFAVIPLLIRAILLQDFVKSFDLPFVKRFVGLMWKEMLLTALFAWVASMVLTAAGAIVFCIGIYAGVALAYFMSFHLYRQLYDLYLSRGGEPIPVSPKLSGSDAEVAPPPAGV